MTSLRPTARNILLNASLGDQGTITERTCGCPFEGEGWRLHVHTIRSDEKVMATGMKFADAELIRVLEDVLPARFGGVATHYQLVEEETADGQSRLRLLVHPSIGTLDPGLVADTFLGAVGRGSGVERDVLRIERRAPMSTATGKILHLYRASPRSRSPVPTS